MSDSKEICREKLSAFVDGELSADDRIHLHDLLSGDTERTAEACQLRKLKEMVREAYREVPDPARRAADPLVRSSGLARAASVFLIVALSSAAGWYGHQQWGNVTGERGPGVDRIVSIGERDTESSRILLHLASGDQEKMRVALQQLESFGENGKNSAHPVQVELIVNGDGLDLVRADASPYAERIRQLLSAYSSVSILACRRAIEQSKAVKGIDVHLLPGISTAPSALERIIARLRDGWTYVKV